VRNLLVAALLAIFIAILVLTVALAKMQLDVFISPHPSIPNETPADYGLSYEDIQLRTEDDIHLSAWFVFSSQPNQAAVVLVHGHGSNRAALLPTAEILARHGYGLLMIDLRAHGQSKGDVVTYGYHEWQDVVAAMEYLKNRSDIHPDRIGLLGQSMGGSVIIRAAARSDVPRAMVVESTFRDMTSAVDDAFDNMSGLPQWPFASLVVWMAERAVGEDISELDSARDMATLDLPVFIIHGTDDELMPLEHHDALLRAANDPKLSWIVEGMGHVSPALFTPNEYERRLIEFLDLYLIGTTSTK
jgi:alpha-beta hydrolase superfamily lysophospholipase